MREDLHKRLLAELSAPVGNQKLIDELVSRANALDVLSKQPPSGSNKKWPLPVFIAAIAIGLVGIASMIRLPRVLIDLDATVSEFQLRVDSSRRDVGGTLTLTPGSFVSTSHPKSDPDPAVVTNFASFIGLQDIRLEAASIIALVGKHGRCYELRVRAGELHGTLARRGRSDSDIVPWPEQISVKAPDFLRFCSRSDSTLFLDGIEALSISKTLRFYPTELHAPSITKGELYLTSTDEHRTLKDTDRLLLAGVRDGKLALRFGESLRLSFSGSVSQLKLFTMAGPSSGGDTDLRPTLADVATSWPPLTALLASVVGLSTALMGAIRWFGLRTQE